LYIMMKYTSCTMCDVFAMASYNPACVLGLDDEIGSIAPGKRANLVFTDSLFNVKRVIMALFRFVKRTSDLMFFSYAKM